MQVNSNVIIHLPTMSAVNEADVEDFETIISVSKHRIFEINSWNTENSLQTSDQFLTTLKSRLEILVLAFVLEVHFGQNK